MMIVLTTELPNWRALDVFEGGAGGALSRAISRSCRSHIASRFLDGVPRGAVEAGFRSEDLEHLTLDDASVDLVITEDVLEHVWEPDRAFSEIARVLRSGGAHVFTVPYSPGLVASRRRIRVDESGNLVHLEPPAYHDDPLDPRGVLVATDWGADLPIVVQQASGVRTEVRSVIDRRGGIDEACSVMVSRKL